MQTITKRLAISIFTVVQFSHYNINHTAAIMVIICGYFSPQTNIKSMKMKFCLQLVVLAHLIKVFINLPRHGSGNPETVLTPKQHLAQASYPT